MGPLYASRRDRQWSAALATTRPPHLRFRSSDVMGLTLVGVLRYFIPRLQLVMCATCCTICRCKSHNAAATLVCSDV